MVEWKTVKLSEVLRYRKGNILINNDEEYSLCRVQLHRRGVVLREKKIGSQIKTKKQQVCRAGDLVVAEMDAKFGGYGFIPDHLEGAIVSSHYYLYELDKNKITQEYFEILIKTDFIQNQIEAKGSTNYSSIRAWEFLDYEIPLQSIALQNIIAAKYLKHSRFKEDLGIELNTQLKYLSQLRQRILQDAIEGKLTANWRVQHPDLISGDNHASKLLEKIKAEKERLIKEGNTSTKLSARIKKDLSRVQSRGKPLEPIADAEKPFDLPAGWMWCRLGEVVVYLNGYAFKSEWFKLEGIKLVRNINISHGNIDWSEEARLPFNMSDEYGEYLLKEGDIVISLDRPIIATGLKVARICKKDTPCILLQRVLKVEPIFFVSEYLFKWINSSFFINGINPGRSIGIPHVSHNEIMSLFFSLPPLAEQQAIVERVDKLMAIIDELEKQVSERKEQAEMLMQSVLREAFAKGQLIV